jgi:hypothetical protein
LLAQLHIDVKAEVLVGPVAWRLSCCEVLRGRTESTVIKNQCNQRNPHQSDRDSFSSGEILHTGGFEDERHSVVDY